MVEDSEVIRLRRYAQATNLISRMLGGDSLYRAAQLEGIPYNTAKSIFSEPEHLAALRDALKSVREHVVGAAKERLEAHAGDAVDALVEVANGMSRKDETLDLAGDTPKARDRVVAASAILDRVGIHPRRAVEHHDATGAASDEELLKMLPAALRALQNEGALDVPFEVVGRAALTLGESTPAAKPAKVKMPPKPQSRRPRKKVEKGKKK